MLTSTLAALATSLALTPLAVAVDTAPQTQTIHVHMDDLDSQAGWDAVEDRIRTVTDRVCRPHGLRGLVAQRVRQEFFNATFADAMGQLNRQYAQANSRSVAVVINPH
jgi:UrcA family protein